MQAGGGGEGGGVYLYVYIKSRDSFVCAEMKRSGHVIRGRLFVTGRGGMGVYTTRGGPVKATVPLQNWDGGRNKFQPC